MGHGGDAPDAHDDGVGELEGADDVTVLRFGPADAVLKHGGEDAEHLAIHVVDGRGEEEQRAYRPARAARGRPRRRRIVSQGLLLDRIAGGHHEIEFSSSCTKNGSRLVISVCLIVEQDGSGISLYRRYAFRARFTVKSWASSKASSSSMRCSATRRARKEQSVRRATS